MMQSVVDYFMSLVQIDSESRSERAFAEKVAADLRELGAEVWFDTASASTGGDTGNLQARFPGTGAPLLFCAHLDTVVPGKGIKPRIEGEYIVSDGTTVLGADDKSGIAEIVSGIKTVLESGKPHPPIEILFTISEEIGLLGAKYGDLSKLQSRIGYALDSQTVGSLMVGAPSQDSIKITVHGKSSHAGVAPEKGVSAIQVAGVAISRLKLGRIDDETTCNLGLIEGGAATNIVAETVVIQGEARSHNPEKLNQLTTTICDTFSNTAKEFKVDDFVASTESVVHREYEAFYMPETEHVTKLAAQALRNLGMEPCIERGGGGSDANIINRQGISMIVVGCGMQKYHTREERILVADLHTGTKLVAEIIRLQGEAGE
jgi:tripeptide aminopeptidase